MLYRKFGETEIEVSEIGFGLWTLAAPWWKPPPEDAAVALLRKAYELGITYYDAAPHYGDGAAETLLRKALGEQRDYIVLATKVGYDGATRTWDEASLRASLDASLERLGTSFVDILYLAHPTPQTLADESVFATLDALREEGKIRYYGASMGPNAGHLDGGLHAIRKRFVTAVHHPFNLLEQDPGRKFFTASLEGNTANVLRDPLGGGALAGTPSPTFSFQDPEVAALRKPEWLKWAAAARNALGWIWEGRDRTFAQAVLRWALMEETVASVLPDIRTEEQLVEYSEAPEKEPYSQPELGDLGDRYRRAFDVPRP